MESLFHLTWLVSLMKLFWSLEQIILDIKFLVEIARCGGFLSENIHDASLNIVSCIEAAFSSAEVTLER